MVVRRGWTVKLSMQAGTSVFAGRGALTLVLLLCLSLCHAAAQTGAEHSHPLYEIQAGDDLTIKVYDRPELEETVRVRPDGKISLVLVDDVLAAGQSTAELDRVLTERYREFYRDPKVTVIVRTFANLRVFVGGQVGRPGPLPIEGKLTVLGAVLSSGGFLNTASTGSVVLLRKNEETGKPLVRKINLKDVVNKGAEDIELQAFDVVYVPMSGIAKVDKFVDQYIRQLIPISLTAGFQYIVGDYTQDVPIVVR